MVAITRATAICNDEVAYLAWITDPPVIPGCLGFHVVREHLAEDGSAVEMERPLASYVPFKGQRNADWVPQNTTVWPIQKYTWRDLTLRKSREKASRRGGTPIVRYRIRAVGAMREGLEPVVTVPEVRAVDGAAATVANTYQGRPRPLGYLTPAVHTDPIAASGNCPPFVASFTNGVLSTQFLLRVLSEDGKVEPGELEMRLRTPSDTLREYLSGGVLPMIRDFLSRPGGRFRAALYELEDEELVGLLAGNAGRLDLVLSDAGSGAVEGAAPDDKGRRPIAYDTRNAAARTSLRRIADEPGSTFRMHDRLFNGSGHIGHNKFVVHVDDEGVPRAVLTGSTNWTWSGVAGQSNNCIRIEDRDVAAAYSAYWERLRDDELPRPEPTSSKNPAANQSDELKGDNLVPATVAGPDGQRIEIWFAPNVPGREQPPSRKAKRPQPPPPDMDRLFSLVRKARRAIFFLVFMPSRGGADSIVSEAVRLGLKDTSIDVVGAISDPQAMWGFEPSRELPSGTALPSWSPHTFATKNVSVVRATALTDDEIGRPLGDFRMGERLTVGRAIIHDKIVVVDPMDPERCLVAFGSHNLGYKASYSNDENLMIVRGNRQLALAYATHVLDVYDHYRFRAVEAELAAKNDGIAGCRSRFDGFLSTTDAWQKKASRRLAAYFAENVTR